MKRFAMFLGLLLVLTMFSGCTAVPPDPGPNAHVKFEEFKTTGTHTINKETSAEHDLVVTFFDTSGVMLASIKCEHGMTLLNGSQAADLYKRLTAGRDKPRTPLTNPEQASYAPKTGAARMCELCEIAAMRHAGWRLSNRTDI